MSKVFEASVQPASGGFGMYERTAEGPAETDYRDVTDFEEYMDREYDWRWADDINGKIYNQNDGRPFAYRQDADAPWSYGLIYVEDEAA